MSVVFVVVFLFLCFASQYVLEHFFPRITCEAILALKADTFCNGVGVGAATLEFDGGDAGETDDDICAPEAGDTVDMSR